MPRQVNNEDLKPGFIFIPADIRPGDIPESYQVVRHGGLGFFAKLEPDTSVSTGWVAISYPDYQRA